MIGPHLTVSITKPMGQSKHRFTQVIAFMRVTDKDLFAVTSGLWHGVMYPFGRLLGLQP